MDINFVKNVINGGQFGQNRSFLVKMVKIGSFLHILGAKITSYVTILGTWSKNFFKFLKMISVKFMDRNLVENVINGVKLLKIGHFW